MLPFFFMKILIFLLLIHSAQCSIAQMNLPLGKRPVLAAHRGGFFNELPENSLAAIDYTRQNARLPVIMEIDIRKSGDGTLWVLHDEQLDGATDGKGAVSNASDVYLRGLKLRSKRGVVTTFPIPAFQDLLAYAKENNILLMLDIKANVWDEVIKMVLSAGLERQCILLTFIKSDFERVVRLSGNICVSFLVTSGDHWSFARKILRDRNCFIAYVTEETPPYLLERLRENGITMMTDAGETRKGSPSAFAPALYASILARAPVDILITDFAVEVADILNHLHSR